MQIGVEEKSKGGSFVVKLQSNKGDSYVQPFSTLGFICVNVWSLMLANLCFRLYLFHSCRFPRLDRKDRWSSAGQQVQEALPGRVA